MIRQRTFFLATAAGSALAMALSIAPDAQAKVTRIVIEKKTSPAFNGANFGAAGQYETLVGKADTVALHKKNAAEAAAIVRGLDDAALARSASALKGMPPMTTEQAVVGILIGHIDEHIGSIRKTVSA